MLDQFRAIKLVRIDTQLENLHKLVVELAQDDDALEDVHADEGDDIHGHLVLTLQPMHVDFQVGYHF